MTNWVEHIDIVESANGDAVLLAFAMIDFSCSDLPDGDRAQLKEALIAASIPHWCEQKMLATMMDVSLHEAHHLLGELSQLAFVDGFPARGADAVNVCEPFRSALREHLKTSDAENMCRLSARVHLTLAGQTALHARIESIYHHFAIDQDNAAVECAALSHHLSWSSPHEGWHAMAMMLTELSNSGLLTERARCEAMIVPLEVCSLRYGAVGLESDAQVAVELARSTSALPTAIRALNVLGDAHRAQGKASEALATFARAVVIGTELSKASVSTSVWMYDYAIAYGRWGDLLLEAGDLTAASKAFDSFHAIAARLVLYDPSCSGSHHTLSIAENRRGLSLWALGQYSRSVNAFERSLDISERLSKMEPQSLAWKRELSAALDDLGTAAYFGGMADLATRSIGRSLDVLRSLAELDPANVDWQSDLGIAYAKSGDVSELRGDHDEARHDFAQAELIFGHLLELDATNRLWRNYHRLVLAVLVRLRQPDTHRQESAFLIAAGNSSRTLTVNEFSDSRDSGSRSLSADHSEPVSTKTELLPMQASGLGRRSSRRGLDASSARLPRIYFVASPSIVNVDSGDFQHASRRKQRIVERVVEVVRRGLSVARTAERVSDDVPSASSELSKNQYYASLAGIGRTCGRFGRGLVWSTAGLPVLGLFYRSTHLEVVARLRLEIQRHPRGMRNALDLSKKLLPGALAGRIVTSAAQVREIFERPESFWTGYLNAPKLKVGRFLLGMDPPATDYVVEKRVLVDALAGLPEHIAAFAALEAERAAQQLRRDPRRGTLELAADFAEPVFVGALAQVFGVPADATADGGMKIAEFIRVYGGAIVSDHPAPGGLEERVEQIAPLFRAHVEAAIAAHRDGSAARWPASSSLPAERTVLGQLIARAPFADGDAGIVRSVTGMLAASASFPKVFASVLHELLERPDHMRAFAAAVLAQDKPRALGYVREALRQRPPFPVLVRTCPNATKLGDASLASGSVVPFFPLAAMFDPSLEPAPEVFDPQRPESQYFLFGGAPRECIGKALVLELFLPMFEALFRHVPGVLDAAPGQFRYDGPVLDRYLLSVNASAFAAAIPMTCPMHRADTDRPSEYKPGSGGAPSI